MTHPDLAKPQTAKRAALAIARVMGADIVQSPDGKTKTVFINNRAIPCTTWLGAYGVVHRLRLDQVRAK